MNLTGLHLLLTYRCTHACDHCFVWGGPRQRDTMSLATVRHILREAKRLGSVTRIAFEGGEPFLYAGMLRAAAYMAHGLGFDVAIVTNGYWATSNEDAMATLRPLARLRPTLSVSSDLLHGRASLEVFPDAILAAARRLDLPISLLRTANPVCPDEAQAGYGAVMFRGRAAVMLADQVAHTPWDGFTACPHENLRSPARVHVDPGGHVHVCQGISIGNLLEHRLVDICASYDPDAHPIVGPLLAGGPAELARRYAVPVRQAYADACHLCYSVRLALRERFPDALAPDAMYGGL